MVKLGNFLFHYRNGLFPAVYLLLFTKQEVFFRDYHLAALVGFAIALTGQLLRFVTVGLDYIVRGGRNRQVYADGLVTGGLFSHCRNPLYVGNYLILVGLGVASCSAVYLFVALPLMAVAYRAIIAAEENFLHNKFGSEFEAYCSNVPRVLFNPVGLAATLKGRALHGQRIVIKEYGSTFYWMAGMIAVVLQNIWMAGEYRAATPWVAFLWSVLGISALAFLLARFLKKKEIFRD